MPTLPRRTRVLVVPAVLALGVALTACTSSPPPAVPVAAESSTPPPATSTPTPTPPPVRTLGEPKLVVKIDNTLAAQPQRGLTSADVVYVEPVEWGLTRLAAVYTTKLPATIGPVRSGRISDIQIFAPYGKVPFVFSGAQSRLYPKLLASALIVVDNDHGGAGFHREYGTGRYVPTNLMVSPKEVLAAVGKKAQANPVGLAFSDDPLPGAKKAKKAKVVTATWQNSSVQFRWVGKRGSYDVWMNGRQARDTDKPGTQRASSVIVQYVKEVDSGYGDKFGGRTPLTITTGTGKGVLLRDGRAIPITWSKARKASPTTYETADGTPVTLPDGQVWIVLKDRTQKVKIEK